MNIVYGGVFNPPTKAHIEIVSLLTKKYPNSKIIILPVGDVYKKDEIISFKYRYEMLKIAFNDFKNVIISPLENEIDFKGTIHSLNLLSETYGKVVLVVGSDNILNFKKWIDYEKLLSTYQLIIIKRNGIDIESEMSKYSYLNVNYEVIEFNSNISSTLIREDIEKNKKWLITEVYNYIIKHNLYRS